MEHAQEVLPYLLAILAFTVVWILNGIKSDIHELKNIITGIAANIAHLERRVSHLEGVVETHHKRIGD